MKPDSLDGIADGTSADADSMANKIFWGLISYYASNGGLNKPGGPHRTMCKAGGHLTGPTTTANNTAPPSPYAEPSPFSCVMQGEDWQQRDGMLLMTRTLSASLLPSASAGQSETKNTSEPNYFTENFDEGELAGNEVEPPPGLWGKEKEIDAAFSAAVANKYEERSNNQSGNLITTAAGQRSTESSIAPTVPLEASKTLPPFLPSVAAAAAASPFDILHRVDKVVHPQQPSIFTTKDVSQEDLTESSAEKKCALSFSKDASRSFPDSSPPTDHQQTFLPCLMVTVDACPFHYQLTKPDIRKVFSRFGSVENVHISANSTAAYVVFNNVEEADRAVFELHGKELLGLQGLLCVTWCFEPPQQLADASLSYFVPLPDEPPLSFPSHIPPPFFDNELMVYPDYEMGYGGEDYNCFDEQFYFPTADMFDSCGMYLEKDTSLSGNADVIRKYTCRFEIGIENDRDFHVARRIIGQKGANMKRIVRMTDAKLRLRGKGSGFLEGTLKQESHEPLHLCISCRSYYGYRTAIAEVEKLLEQVYREYKEYCAAMNFPPVGDLRIVMREHPLLSAQAKRLIHPDDPLATSEGPGGPVPPPIIESDDKEKLLTEQPIEQPPMQMQHMQQAQGAANGNAPFMMMQHSFMNSRFPSPIYPPMPSYGFGGCDEPGSSYPDLNLGPPPPYGAEPKGESLPTKLNRHAQPFVTTSGGIG